MSFLSSSWANSILAKSVGRICGFAKFIKRESEKWLEEKIICKLHATRRFDVMAVCGLMRKPNAVAVRFGYQNGIIFYIVYLFIEWKLSGDQVNALSVSFNRMKITHFT